MIRPTMSEDPPPEGLGDHGLAQTNPRRPTGQVMRHTMDRQPGAVWRRSAPTASTWFSPTQYLRSRSVLDLGVAAMIGLQCSSVSPVAVTGDEGVIAVSGEEGELGTGLASPAGQ